MAKDRISAEPMVANILQRNVVQNDQEDAPVNFLLKKLFCIGSAVGFVFICTVFLFFCNLEAVNI